MREASGITRRTAAAIPLAVVLGPATISAPSIAGSVDPVFEQIERHRVLRRAVNESPLRDNDPLYVKACRNEEAAIQALGDLVPITLAGAAAQLRYMVEVEGAYADEQSPLMRTMLTVAGHLQQLARSA